MDLGVEGNVALLSASSSGLGKASAAALSRAGAHVVINGRDPERLQQSVQELQKEARGEVRGYAGDITRTRDVKDLVGKTLDEFGRMDHLVTSAGGPPGLRFFETNDEHWQDAFDLLVMSVVKTVRASAESLRKDGGGSIVHVTSRTVKEALAANVLSSSVRMAVLGLAKVLSYELAPDVRVNSLLPGSIETPRITDLTDQAVQRGDYPSREEALKQRVEEIPLGRMGTPEEFGQTVAFLCSPRAGFINGAAIGIDGGYLRGNL